MDELVAADHDADVRGAAAHRLEEHQIARLHVTKSHLLALPVLLPDFARQQHAMLREHPLHEPAAIEPGRIASTIAVWHTPQHHRGFDDEGGRWRRKRHSARRRSSGWRCCWG